VNFLTYIQFIAADSILERLGLSWEELLFHAIALIVLVAFLWLLMYRPVKRMVKQRRETIQEVFEKNQKLQQEAADTKKEYDKLLAKAKEEVALVASEATAKAHEKAKSIISEAEKQSLAIVSVAHKETQIERTQMQNEFKDQVADIVIDLAGKVIEREVASKDHAKFIKEALDQWEGN
jgi:F-type H+-transporting ATPase subunit b